MGRAVQSRQLLLVLVAILLPAAVLVAFARRLIRQEEELSKARAVEVRRNASEQVRRELAARLDAVKLQEINRWIRIPSIGETEQVPDSALVLVTAIDGDRVIMPWESGIPVPVPSPGFGRLRKEGESLEFLKKDWSASLNAYREAFRAAQNTTERCEALLLEARVLIKRHQTREAGNIYHGMLKTCDSALDEDGVPFALYAAERLVEGVHRPEMAYESIIDRTAGFRWMSPYQAYLIRSILRSAAGDRAESARRTISQRIEEIEKLQTFAKEFHRVRPLAEAGWVGYGSEPWLINVAPADPPLPAVVFIVSSAVASQKFLTSSTTLVAPDTPDSEPLGEGFNDVNVKRKDNPADLETGSAAATLYAAALAKSISV
jgi:hypothetical protein